MNGNNTQSAEGFIEAFGHPRKKELAGMLLAEEVATKQELVDAGFQRITVLEMSRNIRQNVEGMEDFEMEWPRDEEVVATKEEVEPVEEVETPVETPVEETVAPVETPEVPTEPETPAETPTPTTPQG